MGAPWVTILARVYELSGVDPNDAGVPFSDYRELQLVDGATDDRLTFGAWRAKPSPNTTRVYGRNNDDRQRTNLDERPKSRT